MRKFLAKLLLFILIPILYFGLNSIVNYWKYSNENPILDKKRVLIVGDSHPQRSLNPALFSSAQNISQSSESYVLTYWKLKKIFKSFIPDTLIVGYAPNNISKYNDFKFDNDKWSMEMFKRSYPIEYFQYIKNSIKINYLTYYKTLWVNTAFFPKSNHIYYIGNYTDKRPHFIADCKTTIQSHYYFDEQKPDLSEASLMHLDSIVSLALDHGVFICLLTPPVQDNYLENIPKHIYEEFINTSLKYNQQKHIKIINRIQSEYPDSLFLNCDHLNKTGAGIFTREVVKVLNAI